MLQGPQDGNDLIATIEIQRHGIDGRAIQPRLLLMATRMAPPLKIRGANPPRRPKLRENPCLAYDNRRARSIFVADSAQKTWKFPCFSHILTDTS